MFALSNFRVTLINGIKSSQVVCRQSSTICSQRKKMVVTVIDASSNTGQQLALLLKQDPNIEELRLYSRKKTACGVAMDISAIDTSTRVRAFTGPQTLRDAILNARVVVLVGGLPTKPCQPQKDVFKKNMDHVRSIAMYLAEFNPRAVFCIAKPPINVMVPLASEEYMKAESYDPRKIIGITTVSLMRANTLAAKHAKVSPESMICPVVGGFCPMTSTAVLSQAKPPCSVGKKAAEVVQNFLGDAEDYVLKIKKKEKSGPLSLIHALAASKFVNSLVRALNGEKNCIECAYVRQIGHVCKFLPYMASIVVLGTHGVKSCHMPKLNQTEAKRLKCAHKFLMYQIALGRSVATGGVSMLEQKRCMKKKLECELVIEKRARKKAKKQKRKDKKGKKKRRKRGKGSKGGDKSTKGGSKEEQLQKQEQREQTKKQQAKN